MQVKQSATPDKEKAPLVSFIIPYYNLPPEMLCECIDSILALSLNEKECEIIVIDDGSKDSPVKDLMKYSNDIIYLRQPNRGLSGARNMGLRISTGLYIQFIDGDDKLITANYEHCLDIVRYNAPDIVMFDYTDSEEATPIFDMPSPMDGSVYMLNNNLHASACAYIFKRSILHNLRFTPGLLHEDEEFTPQLFLRAEKVYSTNSKAYFYRKRKESITIKKDKKHILKRLNDTERIIFHLYDMAATLPAIDGTALARRVAQLTMDYIFNIIRLTHSGKQLHERIDRLKKRGLYPLPDHDYTKKYKWFRKMTNSEMGLKILLRTLPLIHNDR